MAKKRDKKKKPVANPGQVRDKSTQKRDKFRPRAKAFSLCIKDLKNLTVNLSRFFSKLKTRVMLILIRKPIYIFGFFKKAGQIERFPRKSLICKGAKASFCPACPAFYPFCPAFFPLAHPFVPILAVLSRFLSRVLACARHKKSAAMECHLTTSNASTIICPTN